MCMHWSFISWKIFSALISSSSSRNNGDTVDVGNGVVIAFSCTDLMMINVEYWCGNCNEESSRLKDLKQIECMCDAITVYGAFYTSSKYLISDWSVKTSRLLIPSYSFSLFPSLSLNRSLHANHHANHVYHEHRSQPERTNETIPNHTTMV